MIAYASTMEYGAILEHRNSPIIEAESQVKPSICRARDRFLHIVPTIVGIEHPLYFTLGNFDPEAERETLPERQIVWNRTLSILTKIHSVASTILDNRSTI